MDPYFCSGDFNLDIWQNNKFQSIGEIEEGYQNAHCMDPESQRLQITAYSFLLDVSLGIKPEGVRSSHQTKLLGTDNLPVNIWLYWDVEEHALESDSSVLCVLQSTLTDCGLILKCHGKYYERVGCFVLVEGLDFTLFQHCTEELCDKSLPSESEAVVASARSLVKRRTIELR
jgi:hypothetical protein